MEIEKRLVVMLNKALHVAIKIAAAQKHLTIKEWVTVALIEKLNKEKEQ